MSKSLGTLTLDLVARTAGFVQGMDKASRESAKWKKKVTRDLTDFGNAAKLATAAAATGLAYLVVKQSELIESTGDTANQLETTYASIVNLKRAGDLGGVAFGKIEAASRKLNINLGLAEQGSQKQVDAFNKLGLSASDLSKLTLDEKIGAINKALVDNVKQSQRASVAADIYGSKSSAAMLQLKPDVIKDASDQVAQFGLNLSEVDAIKVNQARDAMGVFSMAVDGAVQKLVVDMAPAISGIANEFLLATKESGGLSNEVAFLEDITVRTVSVFVDGFTAIKRSVFLAGDTIGMIFAPALGLAVKSATGLVEILDMVPGVDLSGTVDDMKGVSDAIFDATKNSGILANNIRDQFSMPLATESFKNFVEDAEKAAEATAKLEVEQKKLNEAKGKSLEDQAAQQKIIDDINKQVEALEKANKQWGLSAEQIKLNELSILGASAATINYAQSQLDAIAIKEANKKLDEDAAKNAEEITSQLTALQRASEVWGMSASDILAYDMNAKGVNKSLTDQAVALQNIIDVKEKQKEIDDQATDIAESLKSDEQKIKDSYDKQREIILQSSQFTEDKKTELLLENEKERNEKLLEENGSYWEKWAAAAEENMMNFDELSGEVLNNLSSQFGNAFESMVFDSESLGDAVQSMAQSMVRSIVNALGQMAAQWAIHSAIKMALGETEQVAAVTSAAISGPAIALAYAPAAAAVSLATAGANSVPAMSGIEATNALSMGLAGMAHDGIDKVPETGTWLLKKGERVTTSETSAKLDKAINGMNLNNSGGTVVNVVNAPSGTTTRKRTGSNGEEIIDVIIGDLMSDGKFARTMQNTYGVRRSGT